MPSAWLPWPGKSSALEGIGRFHPKVHTQLQLFDTRP